MNKKTPIEETIGRSFHPPDVAGPWEARRSEFSWLLVAAASAVLFAGSSSLGSENESPQVTISSLEELVEYAGNSGNRVRMEAGHHPDQQDQHAGRHYRGGLRLQGLQPR